MTPPIQTWNLSKLYRPKKSLREVLTRPWTHGKETLALKDVSLQVEEGSIFGVLGPNGAGKTTLLKILSGLVLPTAGSARIGGHDVAQRGTEVRRGMGFVTSDERSFYWRLTGKENLQFFGTLQDLSGPKLQQRIAFLLDRLEISEQAEKTFKEYSSGMKQRLAVARALLHDPPVLLLDEPTRSLDPISAKHLRGFILEELNRREGKTLLLATHNLQEAEQLCQRVAVLSRGRVLTAGRVEELPVWGLGEDSYVLIFSGIDQLPESLGDNLEILRLKGGFLRVAGQFSRDGDSLSRLLSGVLRENGKVVSCSRLEPTLQEVFDRIEKGES